MNFNSMQYAFFFIIVCAVYYIIPKKSSYIWLLAASYFFYMQWNAVYAVLILGVTAITYAAGFAIDKWRDKGKLILALTVMANLFLMGYFKYTNFILETVSNISGGDFEALDIILPVGISFYILQALGYVIDVYRGTVEAEHNPLRYALFVSFFPQLVAGPIERSGNLMHQLKEPKPLTSQALLQGIIMIFYGLWTKVLIADGVAIIVNEIFNKYEEYYGLEIIFATVLFAIQIYCDFYGYTIIAIGSAKILGVDLMQNFQSPYMAKNVTDFWKRWHISLTSWFRDYLYIPLGGNRKGLRRTIINTLIVFTISGLWHGAAWHFVLWGLLNGLFVAIERLLPKKWHSRILTFILIDITWFFFRVQNISDIVEMFNNEFFKLRFVNLFDFTKLNAHGPVASAITMLVAIVIMFVVDYLREKKGDLSLIFAGLPGIVQWLIVAFLVFTMFYYGPYGEDYASSAFLYFQF